MQNNMFADIQNQNRLIDTDFDLNDEFEPPTESPFMGNHVVKTVRNLKKIG
jgi:hypothetical protein